MSTREDIVSMLNLKEKRLNCKLNASRHRKLTLTADLAQRTITSLIEEWIDSLPEPKIEEWIDLAIEEKIPKKNLRKL